MNYDFEIDRVVEEIKKNKAKVVALQFPEGFKTRSVSIANQIEEKSGCKTVIFADPCYGACDTKDYESDKLDVDLLIHFGHDPF